MQFPIRIELRRSRLLVCFLALFHTLAATSVIILPWPWLLQSVLLSMIGWSTWRTLQSPGIVGLRLHEQGLLDCLLVGGDYAAAQVLPDSTVFNQLIVLRMRIGDVRRTVNLVLLPDSMSAGEIRVLRRWLRWRADANEAVGKRA